MVLEEIIATKKQPIREKNNGSYQKFRSYGAQKYRKKKRSLIWQNSFRTLQSVTRTKPSFTPSLSFASFQSVPTCEGVHINLIESTILALLWISWTIWILSSNFCDGIEHIGSLWEKLFFWDKEPLPNQSQFWYLVSFSAKVWRAWTLKNGCIRCYNENIFFCLFMQQLRVSGLVQ